MSEVGLAGSNGDATALLDMRACGVRPAAMPALLGAAVIARRVPSPSAVLRGTGREANGGSGACRTRRRHQSASVVPTTLGQEGAGGAL